MIGLLLVGLVAAIHIGIVLAEMVFRESGPVPRVFGTFETFAANTRVLAANQGLSMPFWWRA